MAEYYFYRKVQCVIVIEWKFLKEQVARGLLSNFTGTGEQILSNVSILGMFKMNARVNKLLIPGDKFMPEMHLKLLGFIKVFVAHSIKIKKE